ncbi:hypothetical protein PTTG_09726 [Puccinia triticina 1-1 BBBD Race 1]|uniref:Arrestin-like N-terminal domain-containing protein n=1 Tax=Puccinia triticina (isolate 1-1 / race 1 (BBBD)) TaxID=630390 RepID=A0A180GWA8_PUCT1|nr:hypothetical protein PTTG_09726 [Puccinia triticina 1-1 BBBD Race 1]
MAETYGQHPFHHRLQSSPHRPGISLLVWLKSSSRAHIHNQWSVSSQPQRQQDQSLQLDQHEPLSAAAPSGLLLLATQTTALAPYHDHQRPASAQNHHQPSSRLTFRLSKLLSRVGMSISIDNPLIFLYPKPLSTAEHLAHISNPNSSSSSSNNNNNNNNNTSNNSNQQANLLENRASGRSHPQPALFPAFQPPSPLHPPSSDHPTVPPSIDELDSRSTILSGSLILKFSKPKEIRKIVISLCGQSYIGFNDRPYEYQTILDKELEVDLEAQLLSSPNQHPSPGSVHYNSQYKTYILDKGNYRFHWSFILPPDLPPYERGQFGRTTHKVVAKVKLGSGLGLGLKSVGKNLTSILFGVGGGGHEIETESYFVAISNPSGNNEDVGEDLGLNLNVTELSEQLGPYTLSASSCYFTVAGLLSFKFKLEEIPQRKKIIKIYKIVCLIKQQYRLISIKDKDSRTGEPAESWPPPQRRKVFVLDHSNVLDIKRVLPNGLPLEPSDPSHSGSHTPDCTTSASNVGASNAPGRTTSSHRPAGTVQQTSPSQSRSRSRIRGLLIGPGRSGEHPSGEHNDQSRHGNHSWNGLTSIRLGRRREEPAPSEPPPAAQEPRLYSSRSADRLGNPSPANHQSSPTNNPGTPLAQSDIPNNTAPQSANAGHQRPRLPSHHSVVGRPVEQPSGGSNLEAFEALHLEQVPPPPAGHPRRGRQQEGTQAGPTARDKSRTSRSRGRKSRPEHGPHDAQPHPEQEIPLVTLTDDHLSWEVEHIGRLPTDDIIRPSTNPGTQTNIHIFHTLLFEIHYSVEDDNRNKPSDFSDSGGAHGPKKSPTDYHSTPNPITRKVLSIRKPVQISSCCCMVESMVLPPYSQFDPNAQFVQHPTPSHAARMFKCVCGMSTDVLLKTQNPKNSQPGPNDQQPETLAASSSSTSSASASSSVTTSTLTVRPTSSNSHTPSTDLHPTSCVIHHQALPGNQNCNLNNFDNCFISIK